ADRQTTVKASLAPSPVNAPTTVPSQHRREQL
ncbi:hypothetical protein ACUXK4_005161, partial [Methylorubrum extorquens]